MKPGPRSDFYLSLLSKLLVWGSLFGVLYLLRSFFLLIFLVFIFSYIQANAVEKLAKYVEKRKARVVLVGLGLLVLFGLMAAVLIPQIRYQAVQFIGDSAQYVESMDAELDKLTDRYPALNQLLPQASENAGPGEEWKFRNSRVATILQKFFQAEEESVNAESVMSVIQTVGDLGSSLFAITSQFFLSLLFSFLIVWDLPNLTRGATSLRNTKLRFVYDEIAENLVRFGLTVGRAFEAQFLVAAVNTVLTAVGIWAINIREEIAFISLVVFLCGFIPIAGVFISSIPICLIALVDGGMPKLVLSIFLIAFVHAVESYILNPRIFGNHMKLNPVVVMILMTISGKLFGIWGLILCLPIATYVFQDAIQKRDADSETGEQPTGAEADEPLPVNSSSSSEPPIIIFRGQ